MSETPDASDITSDVNDSELSSDIFVGGYPDRAKVLKIGQIVAHGIIRKTHSV